MSCIVLVLLQNLFENLSAWRHIPCNIRELRTMQGREDQRWKQWWTQETFAFLLLGQILLIKQTLHWTPGCTKTWRKTTICKRAFYLHNSRFGARNTEWQQSYFQRKPFGNRSKSCKIIRELFFGTFGDSCAWLYDKKKNTKTQRINQFASVRKAWENESVMSNVRSAFRDRSHA